MSYESALTQIALQHRTDLQADLAGAQSELEAAQIALDQATRRVYLLEALLKPVSELPTEARARDLGESVEKMTLHAAMQKVLRESPTGKLRAGDIIAEIDRLNLYRMKDGRLPESQQIHARASHYPELFGKDGSFFYAK